MNIKRIFFLTGLIIVFICLSILFAGEKDLKEKRSTHFIVYYENKVDIDFIDEVIEESERYYEQIADNLGFYRHNFWLWDDRAKIYIYLDKDSYLKATDQPSWSGGCADYRNKKLWTYPHAAGFFDSILPHELAHIIFREFVGFGNDIPLWFEEGIASYTEGSKRFAAKTIVKDLISKNKLLTLEQLSNVNKPHDLDKDTAEAFYAQAVSIAYFLINNFKKDRFVTLCRRLKEGKSLDSALDKTYYEFDGISGLYKKWLQYINAR